MDGRRRLLPDSHGEPVRFGTKPLLLADVDGVVSLFGFDPASPPTGRWEMIEGIPHLLSDAALARLDRLGERFEPVWCTGWDEKAPENLRPWPHVDLRVTRRDQHWKLAAIDAFAGPQRALAWVDDRHDASCHEWARRRPGPTLLVATHPAHGLTDVEVRELEAWADGLASGGG